MGAYGWDIVRSPRAMKFIHASTKHIVYFYDFLCYFKIYL